MGVRDFIKAILKAEDKPDTELKLRNSAISKNAMSLGAITRPPQDDVFKAYIPEFLYKPPFGYPLKKNILELKLLAQNPYVFSVIRTLKDEASTTKWEIRPKKEFTDATNPQKYEEQIKKISLWFKNPNGNEESFSDILSCWIQDLCEIDAAVGVKVFNRAGEFSQLYARDGGTFLKNPDIYGYMGSREEFVKPMESAYDLRSLTGQDGKPTQEGIKMYNTLYSEKAAYFQYGWTGLGLPVPFGRREVMYISMTPRSDSIYGRSPLEVLKASIMTLIYGQQYHLDFYLNGNMPDGIVALPGSEQDQTDAFQARMNNNFQTTDALNNVVRVGHRYPVVGSDAKFIPFSLSAKDMEIISQQQWFTKLVWTCFGVPPDEMGYTENSNKAVSQNQTSAHKRRALTPILKRIEYAINTQLMPELDQSGKFELHFEDYDLDEDLKKHQLYAAQITMGLKTPEMIAEEEGINVQELKKQKEEARQQRMEEESAKKPQETPFQKPGNTKAKETNKPKDPLTSYFDSVEEHILKRMSADEPVRLN